MQSGQAMVSPSPGSTFSVEVELTPSITVESETGSDSQGGIGIHGKWDY